MVLDARLEGTGAEMMDHVWRILVFILRLNFDSVFSEVLCIIFNAEALD